MRPIGPRILKRAPSFRSEI